MNQSLVRYSDVSSGDSIPDGKSFRILFDPNLNMMRVICAEPKIFEFMRDAFSSQNDAAFYMSMHGYSIDQKVYLINPFGYFKPGMLFEILEYIRNHFGNLSCVYMSEQCRDYVSDYLTPMRRYIGNQLRDSFSVGNITRDSRTSKEFMELRDYQEEAIRRIILEGFCRGMVELPTSAGKSLVIANLIYTVDKRILKGLRYLIFVPNSQLVTQFYKDLIGYGFNPNDVTKLTSGMKGYNRNARIIISNRQFLFKNKDVLEEAKIDFLINDEVHQGKPKSATLELVDNLDCKFKVGLSATIPRSKYEKLSLVGSFGRVLYVEEITDLQKKGYISKLEINLIKIVDKYVSSNRSLLFNEDPIRKFNAKDANGISFNDAYDSEIKYINDNYIKLYSPILNHLRTLEGNTLVLFDRLEFGKNMFELAKESSGEKSVLYIDGQTPVSDREHSREILEKSNGNIIFGQCSILSTGINIKNLTNLVLMVSTKSFSRILQSIGRTLRLHKDKDTARLFDISFNFKYSQKHLGERLQIYRKMYNKTPDTTRIIEV